MKQNLRTNLMVTFVFVLLLFLVVVAYTPKTSAAELPALKLKIAQAMMPKTSMTHKQMVEMCEAITKRTNGKVTWRIFGPEIGDWTELQRMTMKGAVDVQFNAFDTALDPRWNIMYLPFLAGSWDEARKVYSSGGPYDQLGKKWAQDGGLYYLGTWLNTIGSLGLNTDPVINPEQAKGVKLRVPGLDIFKCYVEKMGFTSVTIPWAETPTAVSTGVVDGWVGSGAVYMYDLFRDVAKTMVATYEFGEMWTITMNLKMWNSLPQEYKTIFQEEANKIIKKHLSLVEGEELENQAKLKKHGWTIVNMAKDHPKELEIWKNKCRECWDVYEPIVGKLWIDKLRTMMGMEVK